MRDLTACLNLAQKAVSWPYPGGISASSLARRIRARTGDAPPVEKAIMSGDRSSIAGMMKVQRAGLSTTLTSMFFDFASSKTALLVSRLLVAATASVIPSRWWAWNLSGVYSMSGSALNASHRSGDTTLTSAPDRKSADAFLKAVSPPPTTRHARPLRLIKIGKKSIVRFVFPLKM